MKASIVIPSYNHAHVLGQAIGSALSQTVPCEVIVVDDGSTDHTFDAIVSMYAGRIVAIHQEHAGPSAARNRGIEAATSDFVMFLDADDTIAPLKVELQLAAFTDDIGWVLCDVRIEDAGKNAVQLASDRYAYDDKRLGGWIQPMLMAANFIPIMSPLVRRSVLDGIRFDDKLVPEDWHFWVKVAGTARCRYVPKVLATYRKSRTGRSRIPTVARQHAPNIVQPLRLNLGCGTPNTRSWHPIEGMVNLDKSMGWKFEDGLGEFVDRSVAGITISHTLMYVDVKDWTFVFSEFARVLVDGGVVRITEDDTLDTRSSRYGGWRGSQPAIAMTHAAMVKRALEAAGLVAHDVGPGETHYADKSLIQQQHGSPPDVFFVEGVRAMRVFLSPHADDECLFGAFTILRYRPRVVVCFGSAGDYGSNEVREAETREAMSILGGDPVECWNLASDADLVGRLRELDARIKPSAVYAPSMLTSHPDHAAVAHAAQVVFGDRVRRYHTYDSAAKVRQGVEVEYEPIWIQQKLRALARYGSQIKHPRACKFFLDDLREYVEP